MIINHIAFLVHSLEAVVASLPASCRLGPIEEQPSEGTREQYVEIDVDGAPSILLLQAIGPGPYRRALTKRGVGLHHLGGVIPHIEGQIESMNKHGLLLHPRSLQTRAHGVVWLCRPELPFLVELMEQSIDSSMKMCEIGLPVSTSVLQRIQGFFSNLQLSTTNIPDSYIITVGASSIIIDPRLGAQHILSVE